MIELAGEEGFQHEGTFNFIDNQINPGTGSISVRGVFKNPKPGPTYTLVPGMFLRVRMQIGQPQVSLLVNDKSVISEQGKKSFTWWMPRQGGNSEVQLGQLQEDGFRVIENGLTPDDWVLVGGLQQVQPGMTIRPDKSRPWEGAPRSSHALKILHRPADLRDGAVGCHHSDWRHRARVFAGSASIRRSRRLR